MRCRVQAIAQFLLFVYSLFFIGRAVNNTISFAAARRCLNAQYSAYANNIMNNQLQASTVFFVLTAVAVVVMDKYLSLTVGVAWIPKA